MQRGERLGRSAKRGEIRQPHLHSSKTKARQILDLLFIEISSAVISPSLSEMNENNRKKQ